MVMDKMISIGIYRILKIKVVNTLNVKIKKKKSKRESCI